MKKIILGTVSALVLGLAVPALAADNNAPPAASGSTIEQTIASTSDLSSLAGYLKTAGLDGALDATTGKDGKKIEYTIFAPTNEAFAKIPEATRNGWKPQALKDLLNHHVVAGMVSEKAGDHKLTAADGKRVHFTVGSDKKFGSAMVNGPSIKASNGTIYLIDTVQVPVEQKAMKEMPKKAMDKTHS